METWNNVDQIKLDQLIILTSCWAFRHWLTLLIKTNMLLNFASLCELKISEIYILTTIFMVECIEEWAPPESVSSMSWQPYLCWKNCHYRFVISSAVTSEIATKKTYIEMTGSTWQFHCELCKPPVFKWSANSLQEFRLVLNIGPSPK